MLDAKFTNKNIKYMAGNHLQVLKGTAST